MHQMMHAYAPSTCLSRSTSCGCFLQKSVADGCGLTVAEAMWKERAVVAGRVGGIQDQIVDRESGHLDD